MFGAAAVCKHAADVFVVLTGRKERSLSVSHWLLFCCFDMLVKVELHALLMAEFCSWFENPVNYSRKQCISSIWAALTRTAVLFVFLDFFFSFRKNLL